MFKVVLYQVYYSRTFSQKEFKQSFGVVFLITSFNRAAKFSQVLYVNFNEIVTEHFS
uniref:Uncharacterized protein n=1 Tax=Arion vulgaris TaxID=1028688 RepID=A0A0B7AP14_9EUPU